MGARKNILEAKLIQENDQRVQDQVSAELTKLAALTEREKEVRAARQHIVEEILNLRCPRCKLVFFDFDGCMALKCKRPGCGCEFCAYCQKDCGSDAHPHVRRCTESKGGGLYPPPGGHLQKVWRVRRQRELDAFLQQLSTSIRQDVITACQADITDLGLEAAVGDSELEKLSRFEEMGFGQEAARAALAAAMGDVEAAAAALLAA
jgi:hypothetical protein